MRCAASATECETTRYWIAIQKIAGVWKRQNTSRPESEPKTFFWSAR
jgi:hypothetical protein